MALNAVAVDPPVQSDGPLMSVSDSALVMGSSTTLEPLAGIYSGATCMPAPEISTVITREYPVATFTWSSSSAVGTLLTTVNFPDALFSIPFIKEKLDDFRYFRSSVRVVARYSSSTFLSGALVMSADVAVGADLSASRDASLVCATGFPHVLLSAASSSACEVALPWTWPHPFLDLTAFPSGAIGSVDFHVLAALQSATAVAAPALTVTVFAQFVDPVVDTPVPGTSLTVPLPFTRDSDGSYPSL